MTKRERLRVPMTARKADVVEEPAAPTETERIDQLKAETDELLDAIDEVLEVEASEFVRSYVQKGGQ